MSFAIFNTDFVNNIFDFLNYQEQAKLASLTRTTATIVETCPNQSFIRMVSPLNKTEIREMIVELNQTSCYENWFKASVALFYLKKLIRINFGDSLRFCLQYTHTYMDSEFTHKRQELRALVQCDAFKRCFILTYTPTPLLQQSQVWMLRYHMDAKESVPCPSEWYENTTNYEPIMPTLKFTPEGKPKLNSKTFYFDFTNMTFTQ